MTKDELIAAAASYLYLNLPPDMDEDEKQWWVNDFTEYMYNL